MIDVQTYRIDFNRLFRDDRETTRASLTINLEISNVPHDHIIRSLFKYLDEAAGLPFLDRYEIEVISKGKMAVADVKVILVATNDKSYLLEQVGVYISQNRHTHYDEAPYGS